MIQNSIKIDLPDGNLNEAGTTQQQRELTVIIDKDEKIYVNNMPTSLSNLATSVSNYLAQVATTEPQTATPQKKRVWITVDKNKSCSAETLITVIDTIKGLKGIQDVAIATKRPMATATT
jgi:biopolymer transport protein ExbD